MSGFYTVLAAENKGNKPNPHGGTLVKWYCTLRNSAGDQLSDVYWQRKPGNDVNPGDTIYGSVTRGEYGPRFKMEPKPDGAQGPPPASSDGPQAGANPGVTPPGQTQAAAGPGQPDERQRRIERQHSQEMAVRYLALIGAGAKANEHDDFREVVRGMTDWFANDLDPTSGTTGSGQRESAASSSVGGEPSPHSPPSTGHPSNRTSSGTDNGGAAQQEKGDAAPPASSLEQKVDEEVASGGLVEVADEGAF